MRGARGAVLGLLAIAGVVGAGGVAGVGADAPSPRATTISGADLAGIPAADRALALASRRWQRLARCPVASLQPLGGAHPGTKVIHVNRTRRQLSGRNGRQRFPYPRRTVIVKTGTVDGTLTLVAIMRKVAAGGAVTSWRFTEYTRGSDGSFSRVGGGQSLCTGCHVSATNTQASDYVFSRLS